MELKRIRLELGRTAEFPEGSPNHGYEFVAPLTKDHHIDAEAWKQAKESCRMYRFWGDGDIENGVLRHVGHGWRFDYDGRTTSDDEPFFKLDQHVLKTGNYVSVTEHDGVQRPFKVVSIIPVGEKV